MEVNGIMQTHTYEKVKEKIQHDAAQSKEADFHQFIQQKAEEIREKLKNGDTEVYIQTGAEAMTEKEWEKMLEKFDSIQEMIQALMKEKIEKQEEQAKNEDEESSTVAP